MADGPGSGPSSWTALAELGEVVLEVAVVVEAAAVVVEEGADDQIWSLGRSQEERVDRLAYGAHEGLPSPSCHRWHDLEGL